MRDTLRDELRARIRGKAKPIGSLGRLEELAVQIGMVAGSLEPGPRVSEKFSFSPAITASRPRASPPTRRS